MGRFYHVILSDRQNDRKVGLLTNDGTVLTNDWKVLANGAKALRNDENGGTVPV